MKPTISKNFTHYIAYIKVITYTHRGYLIDFGDMGTKWLPISQIYISERERIVGIPHWLYQIKFKQNNGDR